MGRSSAFAAVAAASLIVTSLLPSMAANDTVLRRDAGNVGYRVNASGPLVAITGEQSLEDEAIAVTGFASRGIIVFPDSSLVTVGSNTSIQVGAFKQHEAGPGSTIRLIGNGAIRFQIRRPTGGRSSYTFAGSIANISVRGTTALLSTTSQGDVISCLDCGAGDVVVTVGGSSFGVLTGQTLTAGTDGKVVTVATTPSMLQAFEQSGLSVAGGGPPGPNTTSNAAIVGAAAAVIAGVAIAAGSHVGGANGVQPTPTPSPTPVPTPTTSPTPPPQYGPVMLSPSFIALTPGQSATVTASQSGNAGNQFSATTITCPVSGTGTINQTSPGVFQVTSTQSSAGKTCTAVINGLGGQFTTLGMTL
ncbi:MAG: hypothetical protein JO359_14595 [Candidatus Eremiobacteraeota bacterium]|nr:hypothetical protein [Candidatus Eremiobacteraeota bacterium]